MPKFMHSYIENITDVKGDVYCGYRVIALYNRNNENDFEFVRENMINELRLHRHDYLKLYGGEKRLTYITEALSPPKRKTRRHGVAPIEKWFTFLDMGHIAATLLNRVIVKLTKHEIGAGASQTF
ncbi:sex determination protein tasselseed-2 [Trifolium pratense]|uniref:Sex determination protein tasselseed-2 n=1 Tax=Trifolium pratense TaxID=57577 RepID=A0A2K3LWQ0_TRIPR|nr:sex determination protein tasselseed-2 [Trifolium pratense]